MCPVAIHDLRSACLWLWTRLEPPGVKEREEMGV